MQNPGKTQFYCIELRTANWEAMLAWYRNVLELRCLVRIPEDGYALLTDGQCRLALLSSLRPGPATPRWSFAMEVADLPRAERLLRESQTSYNSPKDSDEGFSQITTTDPDGNKIRLFAWEPR